MSLLVGKQVVWLTFQLFLFSFEILSILKETTSPEAVEGCLLKGWTVGEGAVVEKSRRDLEKGKLRLLFISGPW